MNTPKQQKADQLYRILRRSASDASDERAFADLKVYADVDVDELRVYMEQRQAEERRFAAQPKAAAQSVSPFARVSNSQLRQIIETVHGKIVLGAKLELARRDFFEYCHLMAPSFYRRDRPFLVQLCQELQAFYESDELVMLVNLPPRHGKSRTAGLFAMWIFGKHPEAKIMTGSYNETLSTTFSKTVRNGISETKAEVGKLVYSDVFPGTHIKQGDAAMNLWSLDGQYASYLATSPGGTATGFGASLIIIDDLIKAAIEAWNDELLDGQWRWFTDTMFSRLEEGGKILIIMTRWASGDLAGRAKTSFEEQGVPVRALVMKAVQDDGSMLCSSILSRKTYELKTGTMSEEIASANYQQIPVDVKGKLYGAFKTYDKIPDELCGGTYNYTDTADEGADFLCSIDYKDVGGKAYIINLIYTQDSMELTEPAVAQMLTEDGVNVAEIESNNGGRGFARNVETRLRQSGNHRCVVKWFHQGENKKARILTNAAWILENVFLPVNWRDLWPTFYRDINKYQKAGKNAHDDAPDALTGVAEHFVKPQRRMKLGKKRRFGL